MQRALRFGVLGMLSVLAWPAHAGSPGGNVLPPIGHTFFCMHYPDDCDPTGGRRIPDVLPQLRQRLLETVNQTVNSAIIPKAGKPSLINRHWSIEPVVGDCNDYAVTKRHKLLEAGWPASALLLAEVRLIATGEHHLILIVRGKTADWVLDNRYATVVKLATTRNQYILYRVESAEDPKFWTRSLARES
ncbi:MAG TPA: transglutaminase-like cysteine peptidase [Bradyrhizobium sp.]|nr:transglutaminase-like cysteine peptidase [Bradyrhizobium sp.]